MTTTTYGLQPRFIAMLAQFASCSPQHPARVWAAQMFKHQEELPALSYLEVLEDLLRRHPPDAVGDPGLPLLEAIRGT